MYVHSTYDYLDLLAYLRKVCFSKKFIFSNLKIIFLDLNPRLSPFSSRMGQSYSILGLIDLGHDEIDINFEKFKISSSTFGKIYRPWVSFYGSVGLLLLLQN